MDKLLVGMLLAALVAPFLWPAFVMIYRYLRDLEDQRFQRKQQEAEPGQNGNA